MSIPAALVAEAALVLVAASGSLLADAEASSPALEPVVTPASPTSSSGPILRGDILSGVGLEVEVVAPGVFHVLSDGVRDLSVIRFRADAIVTGRDGSVWLTTERHAIKLGAPGALRGFFVSGRVEVAPDGTVWAIRPVPASGADAISSFSAGTWSAHDPPPGRGQHGWQPWDLDVAADGSVWGAWYLDDGTGAESRIARFDGGRWHWLKGRAGHWVGDLVVTDVAAVWAQHRPLSYRDGAWREFRSWSRRGFVGRDGTVWLRRGADTFVRFDASGRRRCRSDAIPRLFRPRVEGVSVAPDGGLWGHYRPGGGIVALARFDCRSWQFPLPGVDVGLRTDIAFGDDGIVWVLTDYFRSDETVGGVEPSSRWVRQLYAITPEGLVASK